MFLFANAWLPGLISNYRQVIISLYTYNKHLNKFLPLLKRPQLEALSTLILKQRLLHQ